MKGVWRLTLYFAIGALIIISLVFTSVVMYTQPRQDLVPLKNVYYPFTVELQVRDR